MYMCVVCAACNVGRVTLILIGVAGIFCFLFVCVCGGGGFVLEVGCVWVRGRRTVVCVRHACTAVFCVIVTTLPPQLSERMGVLRR